MPGVVQYLCRWAIFDEIAPRLLEHIPEYLRRNLGSGAMTVSWLLPLLYVLLALTLVAWAGARRWGSSTPRRRSTASR